MHEHYMLGLVILIGLGAGAQVIAYHARLPSILVLLACGALFGPGLGVVAPDELLGELMFPLVSLGAAIVLFEGGLTARFQDLRAIQSPVARLVSVGLLFTWVATSLAAHFLVGLSAHLSALLGAVLVVTGPTVIGPIIRHSRPGGSVGKLLKYEGIINDPIGAVLALIVFQVIQVEQVETAALVVFWGVARAVVAASVLGILGSLIYSKGKERRWIPSQLQNVVLVALVLGVYALSNLVQAEAGLLAVTVMGMVLASRDDVDVEANIEFAEHLRTMLISVLFILLTARIKPADFSDVPWGGAVFVATLILFIRPSAVFLSTWGTDLRLRERAFLALMAPRGIVAAAVASVFALRLTERGFPGAALLLPLTFLVIAVCVVVYGLSAKPLVRLLSLDEQKPSDVLLLGTGLLSRKIALALGKAERHSILVGEDRREVLEARKEGLRAEFGHIQSTAFLNRLDLEKIGLMVAMTPSDDANTLGCVRFSRHLGRSAVSQVRTLAKDHVSLVQKGRHDLRGVPFGAERSFSTLSRLAETGEVKVTPLTDEFTFDDYLDHYGTDIAPLLALPKAGPPRVITEDGPPMAGELVLSLIPNSSVPASGS